MSRLKGRMDRLERNTRADGTEVIVMSAAPGADYRGPYAFEGEILTLPEIEERVKGRNVTVRPFGIQWVGPDDSVTDE